MSSFVHYVEPTELDSGIAVGLGTSMIGQERISLFFNGGEVLLDSEQAADLIAALAHSIAAMGPEA